MRVHVSASLASLIVVALAPIDAAALRLMTYNILNYNSGREAEFREILAATQPDVLVVQEILSQAAVDRFRNLVLDQVDPGEWAAGAFVNGTDTDNGFYYRTATVTYLSHFVISTALRDIDEWTFRPASHTSSEANVRVYTTHLKASQGTDNEQKRLAEVTAMRARLETFPVGQNYVVAGDFNIYRATEPAYLYMTSSANGLAGVVQDPIDREGNWHNNPDFADVHTQSPRVEQFGGGANGGLDDRFDMMLVGPAGQDGEGIDIVEASYTAFGQDGKHFNDAINVPPYVVIDSIMASNLHDASDHLPVYADFQVHPVLDTDLALDLGSAIVGGTASADLSVENAAPIPADELDYSFTAPAGFAAPPGSFQAEAGAPAALHPVDHPAVTPGLHAGDLTITTDDPDRPAHLVPLTATVLAHAVPSTSSDVILTEALLDLGAVAVDDTVHAHAVVHNFPADAFQASLDVWDAALTGDPRFFVPGGFSGFLVGVAPESTAVSFDAAGAAEGVYLGTLTLSTRDQQDLDGAIDLDDLTFDLTATVVTDPTGVGSSRFGTSHTGLLGVAPNPFRPSTEIRFGLHAAGRVDLRIYDVGGRQVRTLVQGSLTAGVHAREWDGRDAAGSALAPGIYFARFVSGSVVETRKLLRIR